DFCLIPMGTGQPSVAEYIAECQRVLQKTKLVYKANSEQTTNAVPEGPWSEVSQAIHDCHAAVHAMGAPRIATDIRIGTRVDREINPGTVNEGKVTRVERILAGEGQETWQGI
ncbi:YkoF-like protein, partial [Rickenella mellea]